MSRMLSDIAHHNSNPAAQLTAWYHLFVRSASRPLGQHMKLLCFTLLLSVHKLHVCHHSIRSHWKSVITFADGFKFTIFSLRSLLLLFIFSLLGLNTKRTHVCVHVLAYLPRSPSLRSSSHSLGSVVKYPFAVSHNTFCSSTEIGCCCCISPRKCWFSVDVWKHTIL